MPIELNEWKIESEHIIGLYKWNDDILEIKIKLPFKIYDSESKIFILHDYWGLNWMLNSFKPSLNFENVNKAFEYLKVFHEMNNSK